jgi:antitoxin VapB
MTNKIIMNQSEWLEIRPEFKNASSYRQFSKKYRFNPKSKIFRTGRSVEDVLSRSTGERRQIFDECLPDGSTVEEVNARITKYPNGERDADIFIGLYNGFIQLDTPELSNDLQCQKTQATIFMNNRTQAVRLPKQVAFPEDVHQVEIIKIGQSRVISPVGRRWDDLFLNGPRASEDFMPERSDPAPETREPL